MSRPAGMSNATHYHFVVNPVAGRKDRRPLVDRIATILEARGARVTQYVTAAAGDAVAHVKTLEPGDADRLVVVGGDGTLNEVVNARAAPPPWPVAVLPVGTANLVARELGMPLSLDTEETAACLFDAKPWQVGLMEMRRGETSKLAVAAVGVGLDGEIVRTISDLRAEEGSSGYRQWVRPIWKTLREYRFPKVTVTVDDHRTYVASSCIVQNAHSYGGLFEMSPSAQMGSDVFDITLIRARTHRDLFRVLFGSWTRTVSGYKDVKILSGTNVRIHSPRPLAVQADGDPAGETDIELRYLPDAMEMLRVSQVDRN